MIVGILLAAGRGERFGGDKLLARLPVGEPSSPGAGPRVGEVAARNLCAAVERVIAVTRPGDTAVAEMMRAAGCEIVVCDRADEGMGASLACGVAAAADADGWLIALADMPAIEPATSRAVAEALAAGASLAMPVLDDRRGHPVGFSARFGPALMALSGDEGARRIVHAHRAEIVTVVTADRGILHDVDRPDDLDPHP